MNKLFIPHLYTATPKKINGIKVGKGLRLEGRIVDVLYTPQRRRS